MQYGLPLAEAVPLLAALLSLPLPADYAPVTVSPEQQKQQTLHVLLTILLRIAAQQPVLFVMEDLHWVDPSTLELLSLLVDQGPTARILTLFTCRPDFSPPWTGHAHLTQLTVNRLPRRQAVEAIRQVAHGKVLPPEVVEQIVAKTDGVPLFVEELTKMVLESGLLQERDERYELTGPLHPLAIPATLHDSLMARLDRLAAVKALAQLGATLGRAFSYALLRAVAPWDEGIVHRGLHQLVAAEFLYQRGVPPQATYTFKHALIQDVAYQSLLRSTRQHLEESSARYTPDQRRAPVFRMGGDPGVGCQAHVAVTLWLLGYPEQALARLHDALALAHELSHPYSLAYARSMAAYISQVRRDVPAVHEHAEAAVALVTEQEFPHWAAWGTSLRGWTLAMQGQGEAGMTQVCQGISAFRATGAAGVVPYVYTMLADVYDHLGRTADGLQALAEAHTLVEQQEERWWEAEVCRLRGVLLLRQPGTPPAEAETWLPRALDVARRQEAKSLELRAAMSLARLWQQQGKRAEAHALLAPVYRWFTEGFDTADLQDAKALLEELA